jgi:NADH:ubiquinone oxidoreductase subunit 6 (subunit J)
MGVERKKRLNIFSLFFLSTAINIANVLKFSTEIQISVENFKTFEENFLITNAITFKDIGYLLYTHLNLVFILISFSLLIAMFGSIFITIFHTNDLKKQEIFLQIKRENSLFPFSFRN